MNLREALGAGTGLSSDTSFELFTLNLDVKAEDVREDRSMSLGGIEQAPMTCNPSLLRSKDNETILELRLYWPVTPTGSMRV